MGRAVGIRFKVITPIDDDTLVIGRKGDEVVAFELRNDGTNSNIRISKDAAGITLKPGQEKPYAVDGDLNFEEAFTIGFTQTGPSPVHLLLLTEIYRK